MLVLVLSLSRVRVESLYVLRLLFRHPYSNLRNSPAALRQKFANGRVLGLARKIHSAILPISCLIFSGSRKVQNLDSIFNPSRILSALVSKRNNISDIYKTTTRRRSLDDCSKYSLVNFALLSPKFTRVSKGAKFGLSGVLVS